MIRSISVVVPTYNRADLLPQTLEAILNQTSPADQVIVVDDGSTDGTVKMVKARYGNRVMLRCMPNSGDLAARNRGLAAASGNLVAFCDSDDLWRPDFLARMRGLWEAEPRLKAGFGNFRILRDGVWEAREKFDDAPPGFWDGLRDLGEGRMVFDRPIVDRLLRYQPFFPSALVVERGFFLGTGGWDESVGRTVGTDFATMLRLAEHAPLGVLRAPLVGIRKHVANYSADVQAMNLGDAAILAQMLAQRPSLRPLEGAIRASIAERRRQALDTAFARRDFTAVREIFAALPEELRRGQTRVKSMVAGLPAPLGDAAGRLLLALGSLRQGKRPSATG